MNIFCCRIKDMCEQRLFNIFYYPEFIYHRTNLYKQEMMVQNEITEYVKKVRTYTDIMGNFNNYIFLAFSENIR